MTDTKIKLGHQILNSHPINLLGTGLSRQWVLTIKAMVLTAMMGLLVFSATPAFSADINILVLGSKNTYFFNTNSVGHPQAQGVNWQTNSVAFDPETVGNELQSIVQGTTTDAVTVDFQDLGSGSSGSLFLYNQYVTYGESVLVGTDVFSVREGRRQLLRNETKNYDYIVLLDNPAVMEYQPGYYALGVKEVINEIRKGSAEPVLFMPWPGLGASASLDHYKEVVYRTGKAFGAQVVPAGLAWDSEGAVHGATHPTADGAYIAAASIYSQIYGPSASTSSYAVAKNDLADRIHGVVKANRTTEYTGRFEWADNPQKILFMQDRSLKNRANKNSSTESTFQDAVNGQFNNDANRIYANIATITPIPTVKGLTLGRREYSTDHSSYYTLYHDSYPITYAFTYPQLGSRPNNEALYNMKNEFFYCSFYQMGVHHLTKARYMPTYMLFSEMADLYPSTRLHSGGGGGHIGPYATGPVASYQFTQLTGRCPLFPKPSPGASTEDVKKWDAWKIGYDAAWTAATLQGRAPGFKAVPSHQERMTVDPLTSETMTTYFVLPPENDVTVTISSDQTWATVTPQTITFTPGDYDQLRNVTVTVDEDAPRGAEFNIIYETTSTDEVCNDLTESWKYTVNAFPVPLSQSVSGKANEDTFITLSASYVDVEGLQPLTYSIVQQPANGSVSFDGGFAVYTPNPNFVGVDTFTFQAYDGYATSPTVGTVDITLTAPGSYGLNLIFNPGAEYFPLSEKGWTGDWTSSSWQSNNKGPGTPRTGDKGFYWNSNVPIPISIIYQDIDISFYALAINAGLQSFNIEGYGTDFKEDDSRILVEFRDVNGTILDTYDSGRVNSDQWKLMSGTAIPPANAVVARFILSATELAGSADRCFFDDLSFIAIRPVNSAPVAVDPPTASIAMNVPTVIPLAVTDIDRLPADTITYEIVDQPVNGAITGWDGGMPIYTPNTGYLGPDSFTFKANDGQVDSANVATANITVRSNEAPVIVLNSPTSDSVIFSATSGLLVDTTATDDGAPLNPGSLTYTWSVMGGDPDVVFTNPNSPDTGITWGDFGGGTYVFQLAVSDGEFTTTQNITVEVYGGNYEPVIDVIAPQVDVDASPTTGVVSEPVGLIGSDLLTLPDVTYRWLTISGPGIVVFDDTTSFTPTVVFDQVGTYVLRLTGDRGHVVSYEDLTIEITEASIDYYAIWSAQGSGVSFANDANGDGIADGMAWLLGGAHPAVSALGMLPTAEEGTGGLTYNFRMLKSSARGSGTLKLQYSNDLGVADLWTDHSVTVPDSSSTVEGIEFVVTPVSGENYCDVQVTLPANAASGDDCLFMRLHGELLNP